MASSPQGGLQVHQPDDALRARLRHQPRTAPWVQPILNDITVPDPTARMDVLGDKALSVVEEAEGVAVDPAEELENMRSA